MARSPTAASPRWRRLGFWSRLVAQALLSIFPAIEVLSKPCCNSCKPVCCAPRVSTRSQARCAYRRRHPASGSWWLNLGTPVDGPKGEQRGRAVLLWPSLQG